MLETKPLSLFPTKKSRILERWCRSIFELLYKLRCTLSVYYDLSLPKQTGQHGEKPLDMRSRKFATRGMSKVFMTYVLNGLWISHNFHYKRDGWVGWVDIQMIKKFSSQEAVLAHPEWNGGGGGGLDMHLPLLKNQFRLVR